MGKISEEEAMKKKFKYDCHYQNNPQKIKGFFKIDDRICLPV